MKNSPIVARNSSNVIGVLSGWDRLVFRGCIPMLSYLDAMLLFLRHLGVLLKDYSEWALNLSEELKQACLAEAVRGDRPVRYLPSSGVRKDELARQILAERPVTEGLICVLTSLEPCRTFRIRGNRQTHRLELHSASLPDCARRMANAWTDRSVIGRPFRRSGRPTCASIRQRRSAAFTVRWYAAP